MWPSWWRRPKGPTPEMAAIVVEVRELARLIREDTAAIRANQGPKPQRRERVG